jgi:ABC-type polysaccharide/polyol phosphate export permease
VTIPAYREYDAAVRTSFVRYLKETASTLVAFRHSIGYLIMNGLRNRYRRSYLGFLWNLITPFVTMVIVAFVFSFVFKSNMRTFLPYLFAGMIPWTFLQNSLIFGCPSIVRAENYLKKIAVPKLAFPLVSVSTEAVNFFFSLCTFLAIVVALGRFPGFLPLLFLVPALAILFVFAFSLVLLSSVVYVYFRDIPYIVSIVMTALFYLVPILYPVTLVPERFLKWYLLNPFYHFITLFQELVSKGAVPGPGRWGICILISGVFLLGAAWVAYRRDHDLIYRL